MGVKEMEADHECLLRLEANIARMVENKQLPAVFSQCEAARNYIIGALGFRKKRGILPEHPALMSFDVVCKYAPLLFVHGCLEKLLEFIRSTRVLKTSSAGYLEAAEIALSCEDIAWTLWNHIERHRECSENAISTELRIDRGLLLEIISTWEQLGVLIRTPQFGDHLLAFRTQLDARVEGYCLGCGVRGEGKKERFFQVNQCGRCGRNDYFFINYQA